MKSKMPKSFVVLITMIGLLASVFVATNAASGTSLTSVLSSTQQSTYSTTTTTRFSEETTTYYYENEGTTIPLTSFPSTSTTGTVIDLTVRDIMYTIANRVLSNENYSSETKNAAKDLEECARLGVVPEGQCIEIIFKEAAELEDNEVLRLEDVLKQKIKEMYAGEIATVPSSTTSHMTKTTTSHPTETTTIPESTTSPEPTTIPGVHGKIGVLSYYISNGEAAITDCDESATGEIIIPDEIDGYPVTSIDQFAFKNCDSITSVKIGENVTVIKRQAFTSCDLLENVLFPDSLESLWSETFNNCPNLTEIEIPKSVKSIGFGSFFNTNIETVYYQGTRDDWSEISLGSGVGDSLNEVGLDRAAIIFEEDPLVIKKGDFTFEIIDGKAKLIECYPGQGTIEIPPEVCRYPVTEIAEESLQIYNDDCYLSIPSSVTNISEFAFVWADSIATITVSPDNPNYMSDEQGVLYNKDKTVLIKCPKKTTITSYAIPKGVVKVSAHAFNGCTALTEITFPDSVTIIGQGAFYWCTNLKEVEIPSRITVIEAFVFAECMSLEKIAIPDGVTHIEVAALQNCNFTEISIPKSVICIEESVFNERNNISDDGNLNELKDIYYVGTEEEWNRISIDSKNNEGLKSATIHFTTHNEPIDIVIEGGTITSGVALHGETVTVIADQIDGKIFRRWVVSGATVSDEFSLETTMVLGNGEITITAEYDDCECNCHQGGIVGFFFKIVLFFQKLFENNLECFCGKKH